MPVILIANLNTWNTKKIVVPPHWTQDDIPDGWTAIGGNGMPTPPPFVAPPQGQPLVGGNFQWQVPPVNIDELLVTQIPKAKKAVAFDTAIQKTPPTTKPNLADIKIANLYKYSPLSKYVGLEGKTPVRAGTTFVGVEIELENVSFKCDSPHTCTVTEDGSLKVKGKEFVTIPIQFKYLEVELERLFASLKTVDTSSRCSVHVHLNVRDFSLEELKSFIALYMIYERSFYHFSGNRWNNNFCVPLCMAPNHAAQMVKAIDTYGTLSENWKKYLGFNLSPIYGGESKKIGTIEFRHMKGSTDIKHILAWINLIVSLKLASKKIPFTEIATHLETMNTTSGYYWLTETIFKEYQDLLIKQPTFQKDIEMGITQAKSVFFPPKMSNISIKLIK